MVFIRWRTGFVRCVGSGFQYKLRENNSEGERVLYHWYEFGHAAVKPARVAMGNFKLFLDNPLNPLSHNIVGRHTAAACEVPDMLK